ncbi:hypothetical protein [Mucilaginibacter dorajii]|uniref:hypothetical protein n=1 Tax=Mucilaginibacter dorajii TaxID=692994 RepID=UPI002167C957|nr:hypothetical protein [Mucilaginibacter dorajii]MCS3733308.1 hypothetical protein [Mucilaginibacter dorajii]
MSYNRAKLGYDRDAKEILAMPIMLSTVIQRAIKPTLPITIFTIASWAPSLKNENLTCVPVYCYPMVPPTNISNP